MGEIISTSEGQVNLGLWAKLMAPFGWGTGGRVAKSAKLIAKARERTESNPPEAVALYTKAIDLLNATQGMDKERRMLLGPALLGRGKLQDAAGNTAAALDSYLQAKKVLPSIPKPVLSFIAITLAQRGETKAETVSIYLEFIRSLKDQKKMPEAQVVYGLLEKCCAVEEGTSSQAAQGRLILCQHVIQADPKLEWAHYYAGIVHFSREQYDQAAHFFQTAKMLQSAKPLLGFYHAFSTGMQHTQAGNLSQAVTAFRQACQAAPQRADAQFALGKSLVIVGQTSRSKDPSQSRQITDAVSSLEQAVRLDADQADYVYYLGQAYVLAGNPAAAVKSFERATRLDNTKVDYFLHLGLAHKSQGSLNAAMASARAAIALDKQCIPAHRLLGELCLEKKGFQEAARELQMVLVSNPKDVETRANLGYALYSLKNFSEAIKTLEPIGAQSDVGGFWLARCYTQTDQFDRAVQQLTALTSRQPSHAQAWYYLGLGQAHLGRFTEAVEAFEKAIHLDGAQADFYFQRGHAYVKLGHLTEAESDYLKVFELWSGTADVAYHLGCLYRMMGQDKSAIAYLLQVVSYAPQHIGARLALGALHEKSGRVQEAFAQYSAAAKLDSKNPSIHRRLGVLQCRQGDYQTAAKTLRKAAELGDESDELLHYLGLAAANGNDFAGALAAWSNLAARHPDDKRLALNLNKLHYLLGKQHAEAGRLAEAIAE
jgi:tetratricopeptide (TPR) repeat protein